jgi:hypothetical protein
MNDFTPHAKIVKWNFNWKFWKPIDCIGGLVFIGSYVDCLHADGGTSRQTKSQALTKLSMNVLTEGEIEMLAVDNHADLENFPTGFNAMGMSVPVQRFNAAHEFVKEMLPNESKEVQYSIVNKSAQFIKRDEPNSIIGEVHGLDEELSKIDLTGRYRLMAILLT